MRYQNNRSNWSLVTRSLGIAISTCLGTSLPVLALSEVTRPIAQVPSRAIPPTPLNVTPLPGRHIPLPQSRSRYGDYHSDYDLEHRGKRRRYYRRHRPARKNIIIIDLGNRDRYSDYRRSDRVRVIIP